MFEIVGVEDGEATALFELYSSAEAIAFAKRYVSREDAGGWDYIEVNDIRGEHGERVWYWERD